MKDDSGAYAVFAEQGSCASKTTAATIIDVIAILPDFDGQAADAISAHTQVKMQDAPRLLRIPKSDCPDFWIRLPRPTLKIQWFFMNEIFSDIHLLGSCEKHFSRKS